MPGSSTRMCVIFAGLRTAIWKLWKAANSAPTAFLSGSRTNQSLIEIVEAARTRLYHANTELDAERRKRVEEDLIAQEISCSLSRGGRVVIEKILAFYTSLDHAISEPGFEARRTLAEAERFDELAAEHRRAWTHLWEECDIALEEHATPGTDLKLRFDIFHILQTVSPHTADRDVGIPARGWHGEGYRGHIFGTNFTSSRF